MLALIFGVLFAVSFLGFAITSRTKYSAASHLFWSVACKDCDSIEDCDSTGVAIRKATSSVLWGMLYCCAIKVISDITFK